jgi:cellobiose phosphorylase
MYRVGLEGILGFAKTGTSLRIDPCIPRGWDDAEIVYRFGFATYRIKIRNPDHVSRGVGSVTVDGAAVKDGAVPLADDGKEHEVIVEMRAAPETGKK